MRGYFDVIGLKGNPCVLPRIHTATFPKLTVSELYLRKICGSSNLFVIFICLNLCILYIFALEKYKVNK